VILTKTTQLVKYVIQVLDKQIGFNVTVAMAGSIENALGCSTIYVGKKSNEKELTFIVNSVNNYSNCLLWKQRG
jgi:hypothetical protein